MLSIDVVGHEAGQTTGGCDDEEVGYVRGFPAGHCGGCGVEWPKKEVDSIEKHPKKKVLSSRCT